MKTHFHNMLYTKRNMKAHLHNMLNIFLCGCWGSDGSEIFRQGWRGQGLVEKPTIGAVTVTGHNRLEIIPKIATCQQGTITTPYSCYNGYDNCLITITFPSSIDRVPRLVVPSEILLLLDDCYDLYGL